MLPPETAALGLTGATLRASAHPWQAPYGEPAEHPPTPLSPQQNLQT